MKTGKLRQLFFVSTLILLSSCVSQRIQNTLQRYGLDEKRSECVGDRLSESLSMEQLQSLSRAAKSYKQASQTLKIADFVQVGSELSDPQIPLKITQSALQCGLVSADLLLLPLIR